MEDKQEHIRFFTGSLIEIQRLQMDLDENRIPSMIKNNFESGLRAGFYGGSPQQVELFIFKDDLDRAQIILEDFIRSQKD